MASLATSAELEVLFPGSGECSALMRNLQWEGTPLGLPTGWPRSLRNVIPMMLSSAFPMRVLWGPERTFLYNDSSLPGLGRTKHPRSMGRPAAEGFEEIWDVIGPLFDRVHAGESISLEDALLSMNRSGYLEECYFTLSYSPIVDDETGAVGGVLGVVHETTEQVIANRRMATLRELAKGTAQLKTASAACERAAQVLADNPRDAAFGLFYLLDADGTTLRLAGRAGLEEAPQAAPLEQLLEGGPGPWRFSRAVAEAGFALVPDLANRLGAIRSAAYPEPIREAVVLPLKQAGTGALHGFFVGGVSPRLSLTENYRGFFELIAEQLGRTLSESFDRQEREQLIARELASRTEAEELSHAKDEFLGLVSHELRNPLSAMLGWTRLLRTGKLPEEKARHALEAIERNALNQSQLIEDLLDISHITSGKLHLQVQPASFREVVAAAIDSARPAIAAKQLQLEEHLDDDPLVVTGDGPRLQQIVWNLLSNATKFTPPKGKIRVALRRDGEDAELVVADSGAGIAKDFLTHVFDLFRLGDPSSTRTQGGLGLGLSLAKNLTDMHGGALSVESAGEGKGAKFVLRFPLANRADPGCAPQEAEARDEQGMQLRGLNILVVDDEPDARELVAELLEQCGAQVAQADSVRAALEVLEKRKPDVIISDLQMPGEDGFSLIRRIRSRSVEGGGEIPAATLSASSGPELKKKALLLGFNLNMQKPVEVDELIAVVASLGRMAKARHS
jgi:signal transduction histidine kinase/CheY-like chemotaxis protein